MSTQRPKPVVLCILDGWGMRDPAEDNAVSLANTSTWDAMLRDLPGSTLDASAQEVGLPEGQMGNSEVGHMNLGAGRVVMQELPKIDHAISSNTLGDEAELQAFISALQQSGGDCHLMGLLSPGGVHSHQDHMVALAKIVSQEGIAVHIHGFLDGRDMPPKHGKEAVKKFQADIKDFEHASLVTVCGRYWALDRDNRWERVSRAYDLMVDAAGQRTDDIAATLQASYDEDVTDEFVEPMIVGGYNGMQDGDGVLMANFRADRAREILAALCAPDFDGFERARTVSFSARLGMVEYSSKHASYMRAIFPPTTLQNILGQVVADADMTQLRIAETEKYAHVTFFLNGGAEDTFPGEERILIPSPKVATYDLQPEMSAPEVTDRLVDAIERKAFDLIVVNYANGDMVGHTGDLNAAIAAAETIDTSLGRLKSAVEAVGGTMIVTADHGNCEQMTDPENDGPHTQHTMNPVPFIMVNPPTYVRGLTSGKLADVAPTILRLLNLPKPSEMTGTSLIEETTAESAAAE